MSLQGHAWISSWEMPYESGLSLLLKFAWANCASGAEVCHNVFERKLLQVTAAKRHGRSLLDMGWDAKEHSHGIAALRERCHVGSLSGMAGEWALKLGSDARIRYCPDCLAVGYQSAIYQIDAVQRCPIHGVPLHDVCPECGVCTPPYAITANTFLDPFCCPECGVAYCGRVDAKAWDNTFIRTQSRQVLEPFAHWLRQLATCEFRWHRWEEWMLPIPSCTSGSARRVATAQVLASLVEPPFDRKFLCSEEDQIFKIFIGRKVERSHHHRLHVETRFNNKEMLERYQIYKSIRRYLEKRFGRFSPACGPKKTVWSSYLYHDVFIPDKGICAFKLAGLLWRFRMEDVLQEKKGLHIRLSVLNWPQDGTVDLNAWAGYILASFHICARAIAIWNYQVNNLADVDLWGANRVRILELQTEFASVFDIDAHPSLYGVTGLELRDTQSDHSFAVVGQSTVTSNVSIHCSAVHCTCAVPAQAGGALNRFFERQKPALFQSPHPINLDISLDYLRPIDDLKLPAELDGSNGAAQRQGKGCSLPVRDDIEAINAYLNFASENAITRTSYRQQIEKCLVWAVAQRHKPISALSDEDAQEFFEFLHHLQPTQIWLPSGRPKRIAKNWSPFRSVPAARTRDFQIGILSGLFSWWQAHYYVDANPWQRLRFDFVGKHSRENAPVKANPAPSQVELTAGDCARLRKIAKEHANEYASAAYELLINLAYFESLKPNEIASLRAGTVEQIQVGQGRFLWRIDVSNRISALRTIYLLPPVIEALCRNVQVQPSELGEALKALGDKRLVGIAETAWTLPESVADNALHRHFYRYIKPLFAEAALDAEQAGDFGGGIRLRTATLDSLSKIYRVHVARELHDATCLWFLTGAHDGGMREFLLNYSPDRNERATTKICTEIDFLHPTFSINDSH